MGKQQQLLIGNLASGRNTNPLSQISGIQANFDLDATLSSSYGGSGQTWSNIITSPDDGTAQTGYDFYLGSGSGSGADDPTFNGSANDAAAYWSVNGSQFFTLKSGSNTATLKNIHKTTGGAPVTWAMAFKTPSSLTSSFSFGTQTNGGTANGITFRFRSTGELNLFQGDGTSVANTVMLASGGLATSTDYLVFLTMDYTGATCSVAKNAHTLTSKTLVKNTTTTDAANVAQIAAPGNSLSALTNGYRIYGCYLFNKILSDSEVSSAVSVLNSRHNRTYA